MGILDFFFTNPDSSKGLLNRAEKLEERAEKLDGDVRENTLRYARCLRELAAKNWTPRENKKFIRENLRGKTGD